MAQINYYLSPAENVEVEHSPSVAESLLKRWCPDTVPQGLKIYQGDVAECNDVTEDYDILLSKSNDTFNVVIEAGEPATILAVVSAVIAVVSLVIAPDPNVTAPPNANRRQQSANNSFGSRENAARPGERSADIRGRQIKAYPDLLQVPYRRFRNGIEYEYIYAQISEGSGLVTDIKDGATDFNRIDGARLAVYGPGTSPLSGTPQLVIGSAPTETLYELAQSNEVTGATLTPPNQSSTQSSTYSVDSSNSTITTDDTSIDFTAFLEVGSTVTLADFYGYNPIGSGSPQPYERVVLNGTFEVSAVTADTITIVPELGWTQNFDSMTVPVEAWYAINQGLWYLSDPGITSTKYTFEPTVNGIGGGATGAVNISGYNRIILNIVGPQGLYKDDGDNRIPVTILVSYTIHELDANGFRTGNEIPGTFTVSSNPNNVSDVAGATEEVSFAYDNAEITVQRQSDTDKNFNGTVVDEIKWRDLYLMNDVVSIDDSYITTVHAEIKATESALRVKERKLNCTFTRNVEEYLGNGQFSGIEDTPSDKFADVIASIWRDPLFGRGEDDEVNWEQLFTTQTEMVSYYGGDEDPVRVGYTFDSDKITAEDAIKLICNAVNVIPYRIGSVLNFWFEKPQSQSSMQFGHRFKHPGTDQRSRSFGPKDDKTGVELTYFDEATGSYEVLTRGDDTNLLKIELSGCITARGAQIRIDREWNKLRYSRVQHGFDATAIGRMAVPGMRVDVIDNTRYAPFNGQVRAVDGLTLTLSQPVTLGTPTDYSIVLTLSDGSLQSLSIADQPSPDKVTLATAPAEAPQVGRDADRTAYSIATDDERTELAMLVREINPKDYNRVGIACINYDSRYYDEDNPS